MAQRVQGGAPRERKLDLAEWERAVDRQIREAQERGEFDQLPGMGKPLRLDDDPFAGEWAQAYRMVKQAGASLPWIELAREIQAERERLQDLLQTTARYFGAEQAKLGRDGEGAVRLEAERLRARAHYLDEAAKLDEKLASYSLMVPVRWLDKGRLPPHVAADQFDAAVPGD